MILIHLMFSICLCVSHLTFFIRGIVLLHRSEGPSTIDRVAKRLSQLLLPVTVGSGLLAVAVRGGLLPVHGILGVCPLILIPLVSVARLVGGWRKSLPWLLPAVNLSFLIAALVTGFFGLPS